MNCLAIDGILWGFLTVKRPIAFLLPKRSRVLLSHVLSSEQRREVVVTVAMVLAFAWTVQVAPVVSYTIVLTILIRLLVLELTMLDADLYSSCRPASCRRGDRGHGSSVHIAMVLLGPLLLGGAIWAYWSGV